MVLAECLERMPAVALLAGCPVECPVECPVRPPEAPLVETLPRRAEVAAVAAVAADPLALDSRLRAEPLERLEPPRGRPPTPIGRRCVMR